jgi:hypothetical protein
MIVGLSSLRLTKPRNPCNPSKLSSFSRLLLGLPGGGFDGLVGDGDHVGENGGHPHVGITRALGFGVLHAKTLRRNDEMKQTESKVAHYQWLVTVAAGPRAASHDVWQFPAVGPGSVAEYQARALAEVNLEADAKRKKEGEVAA